MQRIIVATDGSPDANRAVDVAARLAKATGASLTIMTVGGHISGAELRRLASHDGDLSEAMKSAVNKILKQAQTEWKTNPEMNSLTDQFQQKFADVLAAQAKIPALEKDQKFGEIVILLQGFKAKFGKDALLALL